MNTLSEAVAMAKTAQRLVAVSDAVSDLPTWVQLHSLFNKTLDTPNIQAYNFAMVGIDHAHQRTDDFNDLIDIAKEMHEGAFASSLAIVHFLNATDNEVPKEAEDFYTDFIENNPEQAPDGFESMMFPSRHSDPIDGIYIQCQGNTFWIAYYDDHVEKFALKPGDIMIIPKGIDHSVESLTVRAGLSIAMAD